MANPIQVIVDSEKVRRKLAKASFFYTSGQTEIRRALRKGAKPWPEAVNNGQMYRWIKRDTGASQDPIGLSTWYAPVKQEYGVKARPVKANKKSKNAGWRAHFFASPAKHISAAKKVPFNSLYQPKTGQVLVGVGRELSLLFKRLFV
jgi:hypothetical protein